MDFSKAGNIIKQKRLELGITQEQLAEAVDLCADYICKLERGKRIPGLVNFIKILNVLDLSADEVLTTHLNKSYVSRTTKYTECIGKLSKSEQDRIFRVFDAYFGGR